MRVRERAVTVALAMTLLATACSDDDDSDGNRAAPTTAAANATTSTAVARPDGPVADVSEAITGENPPFIGAATEANLPEHYVEEEYVASGTASSYAAVGELTSDGVWTLEPGDTAAYRTRVLVRRPATVADFSGTVLVEWLNVSGGVDANPDYVTLEEEILRRGHVWVGVSAQLIGIEGGPVLVTAPGGEGIAGEGLKSLDAERYGSLEHPGDGFSYDIYTQVARALRAGEPLGGFRPEVVIAVGESQSAIALTTYYNGVQPLTEAFDAFFVHSRGASGLPLVGRGEYADLAGSIGAAQTTLRGDLDAPVMMLQSEGDIPGPLNSLAARQPDSDTYRLWEVAGTAHADARLVGESAALIECGVEINDAPFHVVAKAALRALDGWARTGEAPPEAPRVETSSDGSIVRDADGIAQGGIRTPPVDVPVDVLSGAPGPSGGVICLLLGSTIPLPDARLAELYESRTDYERQYEAAVDDVIAAGFALEEDREALMAYADPSRLPG